MPKNSLLQNICSGCLQNNWKAWFTDLVKCKYCGLIRAEDRFFKFKPDKLYSSKYYQGIDYFNYQLERKALERNFQDRIKRIKKYKLNGQLLDIGCAYGDFLKVASQNGYNPAGIEVNKKTAVIASNKSGTKVYWGDIRNLPLKPQSIDIITMFDAIEHLKDPYLYLSKCRDLLKIGGFLVIETGDIESILAKVQKRNWRLITPPTHLYYFSPKTIKLALLQHGFEVKEINYVSFYRTIGQTIYRLTRNPMLIKSLKPLLNKSFPLNTYDLMFVVAKRKV